MRVFVIADASKRKSRPVGVLVWEPDSACKRGKFSLELSMKVDEGSIPLSLSFCVRREGRRATPEESEAWVRSRIVPEDRQNIVEVLRSNGLADYNEVALFAACQGRSSDDDLLVYEVDVPSELKGALGLADDSPRGAADDGVSPRTPRADRILNAVQRTRDANGVTYSFVALPGLGGDVRESLSMAVGRLIRAERLAKGLTQTQLAARAGIAQAVLSRIESGAGNPTLGLIEDVSAALGLRLTVTSVESTASHPRASVPRQSIG